VYRPEKEHSTQLRALHLLFKDHPEYRGLTDVKQKVRLVMMGSSRNVDDERRIEGLRSLARELEIEVSI
jgi:alpha-1,2-mannosyltransferase